MATLREQLAAAQRLQAQRQLELEDAQRRYAQATAAPSPQVTPSPLPAPAPTTTPRATPDPTADSLQTIAQRPTALRNMGRLQYQRIPTLTVGVKG